MPGVWLHPQPCVQMEKAHKCSHYRRSRDTDIPCATVLTAYLVLTPERPGFVVSVAPRVVDLRDLAPAAGAPDLHAFAVRITPHV
jgi:hypothetical protein